MSIEIKNLSKNFGNQTALDNVSFSINKGEIVGFLGPNGAGKSTLMKIITGYLNPTSGEAIINQKDIFTNKKEAQLNTGYLAEHNPQYLDLYIKEYLDFSASIYNIPSEKVNEIISLTGLDTEIKKKIKKLSKGYRQRVGIANALLHNPETLILDEPTTGLDPNQLIEIRALIKNIAKDKTVLLSTHIMQEVEALCDRIIIINKGKILKDINLSEIDLKNQNLETLFRELTSPTNEQ